MIYTYVPYAPSSKKANLGWTYNNFMKLLPNENDWACFLDHDACFTTTSWYSQLEHIIETNPEYGLFTCLVNRIGVNFMKPQGIDESNHDISYHRQVGSALANQYYSNVRDITNGTYLSGVLILVQKKTWSIINGCSDGFLGVDNEIHIKCASNNIKVGLMQGVYLYHWYRADGNNHVVEAMKYNSKPDLIKAREVLSSKR